MFNLRVYIVLFGLAAVPVMSQRVEAGGALVEMVLSNAQARSEHQKEVLQILLESKLSNEAKFVGLNEIVSDSDLKSYRALYPGLIKNNETLSVVLKRLLADPESVRAAVKVILTEVKNLGNIISLLMSGGEFQGTQPSVVRLKSAIHDYHGREPTEDEVQDFRVQQSFAGVLLYKQSVVLNQQAISEELKLLKDLLSPELETLWIKKLDRLIDLYRKELGKRRLSNKVWKSLAKGLGGNGLETPCVRVERDTVSYWRTAMAFQDKLDKNTDPRLSEVIARHKEWLYKAISLGRAMDEVFEGLEKEKNESEGAARRELVRFGADFLVVHLLREYPATVEKLKKLKRDVIDCARAIQSHGSTVEASLAQNVESLNLNLLSEEKDVSDDESEDMKSQSASSQSNVTCTHPPLGTLPLSFRNLRDIQNTVDAVQSQISPSLTTQPRVQHLEPETEIELEEDLGEEVNLETFSQNDSAHRNSFLETIRPKFKGTQRRSLFQLFFNDKENDNKMTYADVLSLVEAVGSMPKNRNVGSHRTIVVPGGISFASRAHGKKGGHAPKLRTRQIKRFRRAFEMAGITPQSLFEEKESQTGTRTVL